MLPAGFGPSASLADVMTSCLTAITGGVPTLSLPRVSRAVVVLADGLGAQALRSRSGHARFLAPRLTKSSTIVSGSPTTTAAALATLCTGRMPGEHGIVGYRAYDPATDSTFNHLSGWAGSPDPVLWQRCETIFEQTARRGIPSYAVGPERYRTSSYTRAVLRGADYVGAADMLRRVEMVRELFDQGGSRLVYLYVPELDVAAHAHGSESDAWLIALEEFDAAMSALARSLRTDEGALITADHGVVDVPARAHVLYDTVPELVDGVRHVAGDPRMLQLHLTPDATAADEQRLATAWRETEGHRSWVATRAEAIEAGWFGPRVDEAVAPRIGNVLVAARARIAYYDSTPEGAKARRMIGQHGSLTPEEQRVPLIRLGAFE
ncbi:alkaline phosphatase family protein [Humibacter ginsenosidimutans]|uniref:Alkaline phosphatase family protein n=2 Tax=Humibacter ginsenosidimutans TaxID=2599293 RepID=A0A5B8M835_9MICO|nr:alkaline phosphatase family protein [Humibacter ginsenosidimutans]